MERHRSEGAGRERLIAASVPFPSIASVPPRIIDVNKPGYRWVAKVVLGPTVLGAA